MSLSDEILKRTADAYRRIRNTARFLLGNLHGFDPARDLRRRCDMVALDRWIVHRAHELQQKIAEAYARYDFAEVVQALCEFLQRRSRRAVPRRHQGPAVHDGARIRRGRRSRAERDVPHQRGVRALDRADPELHRRRDVAAPAGVRQRRTMATCCSRPGTTACSRWATMRRCRREDFDRLLALRDQVAKVLEPMRADGEIGAALDAEIALQLRRGRPELAGAAGRTNCASC